MTNQQTLLDEARKILATLSESPDKQSNEYYARNNLLEFIGSVSNAHDHSDVKRAGEVLSRFAVDSLEFDSSLFRSIVELTDHAHKFVKAKEESGRQ